MKVKVIRKFRDKETKSLHEINSIIELSPARFREINGTAKGLFVKELIELESMTKKELLSYAEENGIEVKSNLNKAELIRQLGG